MPYEITTQKQYEGYKRLYATKAEELKLAQAEMENSDDELLQELAAIEAETLATVCDRISSALLTWEVR